MLVMVAMHGLSLVSIEPPIKDRSLILTTFENHYFLTKTKKGSNVTNLARKLALAFATIAIIKSSFYF